MPTPTTRSRRPARLHAVTSNGGTVDKFIGDAAALPAGRRERLTALGGVKLKGKETAVTVFGATC